MAFDWNILTVGLGAFNLILIVYIIIEEYKLEAMIKTCIEVLRLMNSPKEIKVIKKPETPEDKIKDIFAQWEAKK